MATDMKEAIRRLIYRYVVEGADEVMKTQEKITKQTEQTDKASLSLEKAFSGLERKYVDTVRAQQDYEKVQKKVNDAVAQNPALQERANAILAAAKDKFDSVAAGASKAGTAATILSKAMSVIIGPAGLMGVALTAIGTAAGYMWSKFADQSAITTIEQALEEQNRLLKEAKLLIDAKASAEARAGAQSRELTEFQIERSQRDLQGKIGTAQEAAAIAARARSTRPTQVAGEMGEAPTGVVSLGPGYEQIADAVQKLNNAMAEGKPGLAAFQEELAKVGRQYPELAQTAEELIKIGASGMSLEQAQLKLKAMSDALKGIATDAQLAAVGLGSIAQFQVNNLMATQAAEATERQAQATLQISAMYPGMTIEGAKQLYAMQQQLTVAQARVGVEQLNAQQAAMYATFVAQGVAPHEAMARAAMQRQITEATATQQAQTQIGILQGQLAVAQARTGAEALVAQEIAKQKQLLDQNVDPAIALKQAALERKIAEEQINKQMDNQIKALEDQLRLADARRQGIESAVKAEIEYKKNVDAGGDVFKAGQLRDLQIRVDRIKEAEEAEKELQQTQQQIVQVNNQAIQQYNQALETAEALAARMRDHWQAIPGVMVSINDQLEVMIDNIPQIKLWTDPNTGKMTQFNPAGYTSTTVAGGILQADQERKKEFYGAGNYREVPTEYGTFIEPNRKWWEELMAKNTEALSDVSASTNSLNATMQSALSPYYSQDPRTTKLGFRAGVVGNQAWLAPGASNDNPLAAVLGPGATAPGGFASGGSFVVPGGYSGTDNKIAQFPVASGEQVVVNRRPQDQGGTVNIDNRIVINGSVDTDTLSKLKVSRYQQAQRMRGAIAAQMAIDNIRLPVEVERGATGGPRFKTSIQVALSGIEQRIAEWDFARCEYDIGYAVRGKADLISAVIKLWRARQGPAYPFRFKDWSDYDAEEMELGTGDGVVDAFQLVKTYSDTIVEVTRTIQLPVEGTVEISVNSVLKTETTHYTIDYSTGVVTFTPGNIPAAAQAITATFEFDVPTRFADDKLEVSMTMDDFGDIPSIPLIEVLSE